MNGFREAKSPNTFGIMMRLALWACWQLLASLTIVFLTTNVRLGSSFWKLPLDERLYLGSLASAYLLAAVVLSWKKFWNPEVRLRDVFWVVSGAFAVCGFCLFWASFTPYSRSVFTIALAASYILASLTVVVRPKVLGFAILVLLITAGGLFIAYSSRAADTGRAVQRLTRRKYETSALYNLALTVHSGVVSSKTTGGAVKAFGAGFLAASGDGVLYYFEEPQKNPFVVQSLPYRIPMNRDEFQKAITDEISNTFRVADILPEFDGQRLRLFASHHYWNAENRCNVLRVSMTQADRESFLQGKANVEWKTIYDTKPCLPLNATKASFGGKQVGGRMVQLDEQTILLSVGDEEFDGWNAKLNLPQDPTADWGKTIRINTNTGTSSIYTSGHRNPQGLLAMSNGEIWLTEHGPRGGDELNLLVEGANYGWPFATYGTEYGALIWPLDKSRGHHAGYEQPIFSWVPSIATSNLIDVRKDLFALWRGDLLVASLGLGTLYRVRMEKQRATYVEPVIKIGRPIRDLVEGLDGRIVLLMDGGVEGGSIGVLEPIPTEGVARDADTEPKMEALLLGQCRGCHPIADGSTHGIGPDLRGVVGRRIASVPGYNYSPALQQLSGRWTPERLSDFLYEPTSYAPGTAMETQGVLNKNDRRKLIEYLATQQ